MGWVVARAEDIYEKIGNVFCLCDGKSNCYRERGIIRSGVRENLEMADERLHGKIYSFRVIREMRIETTVKYCYNRPAQIPKDNSAKGQNHMTSMLL